MDPNKLPSQPMQLFASWLKLAEKKAGMNFVNSMALATADKKGRPSLRMVLLKGFDQNGFYFFTNYKSRKGQELSQNPNAALCFYWDELLRQVRVQGKVKKISHADSLAYFRTRSRGSQIGAWASAQSTTIPSRKLLEQKVKKMEAKFQGKEIPLPPYWGGFHLEAQIIEFWMERNNRLHDRVEYKRSKTAGWKKRRLSP